MALEHRVLIPVRTLGCCSKLKYHEPSGPRTLLLGKGTIVLERQLESLVIGMNAVYVRPASWRSSTVLSMRDGHKPLCERRQRRQFGVAARPGSNRFYARDFWRREKHLGNEIVVF